MIRIGTLQVDFQHREIRKDGATLKIGARAFEILEALCNANGALVSKDEIMRHVWPGTVVEENNLAVHVATLRKLLGDDRELIRTVQGRGYRLLLSAEQTKTVETGHENWIPMPAAIHAWKLDAIAPLSNGELIGREAAISEVLAIIKRFQSVTLVGTGGSAAGVALVAAAAPYLLELSLTTECRERVQQALDTCEHDELHDIAHDIRSKLHAALSASIVHVHASGPLICAHDVRWNRLGYTPSPAKDEFRTKPG
jgi:DNA-binding winged helix-turn-helix (wHTH) protein